MIDLDVYLEAIGVGDTAAFARWVSGAEPALRASLASFAFRVDVEVVVQEALLRAWQLAPRVERDGRENSLLRFSLRTARNLAIDDLRKHKHELLQVEHEAELSVTTTPPDPLLRRAIAACREQLPEKPARALEARLEARGAESDESIALRLGMKPNTLLKNFGRARQFLLECLARRGIRLNVEMAA